MNGRCAWRTRPRYPWGMAGEDKPQRRGGRREEKRVGKQPLHLCVLRASAVSPSPWARCFTNAFPPVYSRAPANPAATARYGYRRGILMYAVFKSGGKQYRVAAGDQVRVEKLPGNAGDTVTFDQVLMVGGDALKLGKPLVGGAK